MRSPRRRTAGGLTLLVGLACSLAMATIAVATPAMATIAVATPAMAADAVSELAAKYAPVVVMRDQPNPCGAGEPYLPTRVESVLGQRDVTLRGPGGRAIAAPTAMDLVGKGEGWYLDLPGNPLAPGCDYEQWFKRTVASQDATVYAHVATDPKHPGKLALQYWFFWVFNDWNDKHEGDWEMLQLLFDADSPEAALLAPPVSAAFAQHEGSETASWSDDKVVRDGDHVVIYPGQGSHAAYYTQAQWFGSSAAAGFGCDSTLAQGDVVRPSVVVIPADPGGQFGWLDFTGRWGQKAPSFNNGPTGPNTKMQWSSPVSWQEEKGRDGAVSLPFVGGPAVESFCSLTEVGSLLFVDVLDHPILTALPILALLLLIGLSVRGTRWRRSDFRTVDRERRAGQVAVASFALLIVRIRAFWPLILVTGLSAAAALGLQRLALRRHSTGDIADLNGFAHLGVSAVIAVAIGFALAPAIAVTLAATARVVDDLASGRPARPWTAIAVSIRHPSAALAQLVVYFVVTLLATSLVLLPIALFLISLWAVAMPSAAIEGGGLWTALHRSRRLTRGRRWRTILLSALLIWVGFTLPGAIGGILLLATGWPFWATNLVAIALAALLLPFSAVGLTLQFYDFRQEERRDARASAPEAVGA